MDFDAHLRELTSATKRKFDMRLVSFRQEEEHFGGTTVCMCVCCGCGPTTREELIAFEISERLGDDLLKNWMCFGSFML